MFRIERNQDESFIKAHLQSKKKKNATAQRYLLNAVIPVVYRYLYIYIYIYIYIHLFISLFFSKTHGKVHHFLSLS